MRIIVDAFGGDNAPLEIIKGSALAADEFGADIVFVGDERCVDGYTLENAPDYFTSFFDVAQILDKDI